TRRYTSRFWIERMERDQRERSRGYRRWQLFVARSPRRARGPLELERKTADDALGWTDDEELVVHRLVGSDVADEVPHRQQHLPLGSAEVHERERLAHLNVEARIEDRPIVPGSGIPRR